MAWSIQQIKDYITTTLSGGYVPSTRAINTSSPLAGGGDLSADRTISLDPTVFTVLGFLSAFGAGCQITYREQAITISGATSDSAAFLLPSSSLILFVIAKATTTISGGGVTQWEVGDATTPARFSSANANLTAGNGGIGINQWKGNVATESAGPTQSGDDKVRITCDGAPSAGVVNVTVFYIEGVFY